MSNSADWQQQEHPIDPAVRAAIEAKLAEVEVAFDVRVLFACESGSRGWGFASPDSDYDVRFIYVQRLPWYLTVSPQRDVIELPVSKVFDVSGWELRKALGLLKKAMPRSSNGWIRLWCTVLIRRFWRKYVLPLSKCICPSGRTTTTCTWRAKTTASICRARQCV